MSVETDSLTGEPHYRVSEGQGQRCYSFRDIIHIAPLASLDGVTGEAPIRTAREAIGLCVTLEAHAARLFSNKARPSGFLKLPKIISPEAKAKARAAWKVMEETGGKQLKQIVDHKAAEKAVSIAGYIYAADIVERLKEMGLDAAIAAMEAAFPNDILEINRISEEPTDG